MSTLREFGLIIGRGVPGASNSIVDVPGVLVGQQTVESANGIHTGVTAILPHGGDLYRDKLPAAVTVINGYGKITGQAQIEELGVLETPIVLTNTLSVGTAWNAVVTWMLDGFDRAEAPILSINPLVAECNDGRVNDIRARAITEDHVLAALRAADASPPAEGCVGAGVGMTAFGWKSGIGSASRCIPYSRSDAIIGVLALPNFGRFDQLEIRGVRVGERIPGPFGRGTPEGGSIVVVIATDLPCSARQLGRLARRAAVGIARTGGRCDGTSGEFAIAFSTARRASSDGEEPFAEVPMNDLSDRLDGAFGAVIEATEEAILSALFAAESTPAIDGETCLSLPRQEMLALVDRQLRSA
jgi:D-aminopeptidase